MKKLGYLLMFFGIVLLAVFLLADLEMTFQFWLIGFLISMLVSGAGIVLLILDLWKAIKLEKANKVK
ncbi:hypothetical protein QUF56_02355 [Ureibacillus composti]|uniref:Uncharacterized protein n=1 Tax=Lysinibacillus composti TaxID=720633 RepID=A0A3N9UNR0_9BACI|nr:hypothetical protein [Lysinibacillus composti]MBM7609092.1 hypothetical protein [Lysinibacillus composti]MDM5332080.1 hypothetical protein [Ureibacillus composti]RQW74152.1 hypothetical protein EBB45_12380 [Lysinibacillus composti]